MKRPSLRGESSRVTKRIGDSPLGRNAMTPQRTAGYHYSSGKKLGGRVR